MDANVRSAAICAVISGDGDGQYATRGGRRRGVLAWLAERRGASEVGPSERRRGDDWDAVGVG